MLVAWVVGDDDLRLVIDVSCIAEKTGLFGPTKPKYEGAPQKTQNWNGWFEFHKQGIVVQSPDFEIDPKPKNFYMAGGCKLQPKSFPKVPSSRQETEAGPDETAEAEPNPVYCYFASEVSPGFFLGSQGRFPAMRSNKFHAM